MKSFIIIFSLVVTVGTREAGMARDRFSPESALAGASLHALANSETNVVVQDATEMFIAFEAETIKAKLLYPTRERVRCRPRRLKQSGRLR
jgi:hypothetical protein